MTNPNNAVGTNAAFGGRTSVNAFNDVASVLSRGIITGWVCSAGGGMSVNIGGTADTRDVAIALDNSGNKTTINNISDASINLTIDAAPAANSRYDVVVAYVDNPAIGNSTDVDNPGACGIIVVKGTASSSPVVPNESAIRTAITSDGASGSTAYYVVLAQITVGAGTTVIASGNITQSAYNSTIASTNILDGSITSSKIGASAVTSGKIANNSVTTAKLANASVTFSKIDWTTVLEVVGTTTGDNQNYAIKYADGRLVCVIRKTATVSITNPWSSLYGLDVAGSNIGNWAVRFIAPPVTEQSVTTSNVSVITASYQQPTLTTAPGLTLCRPQAINNASVVYNVVAYGFWK